MDDIKQIGFLTDKTVRPNFAERPILGGVDLDFALSARKLQRQNRTEEDSKFIEAPFLVATRKEKDAFTESASLLWAKRHGKPVYYW